MKRISCLLIVFIHGLLQAQTSGQLDSIVAHFVQLEKFNGSVLVASKGSILLQKGYGYKNAARHEQNDANSIFQIGSITKQFTASIILQLQEQKKLSLTDKLSKYFPELPFADSVTLEQLLSHTSGIYNYTNNGAFMASGAMQHSGRQVIFDLFKNKPLEFTPGTAFNYSNSGYMLLGYIIEKITGQPYESIIRKKIFAPLQMNTAGFDFVALSLPNKATGYSLLTAASANPAPIADSTATFAAGGIYATTADLYKWDRALYTERIISKASLRNAYTIRKGQYGLGWVIDSAYGHEVYSHSGGIFGFGSFFARSPEEDICIVLLDNKGSGGLQSIAEALNAALHHKPVNLPKAHLAISVDSNLLKTYTGTYQLSPNFYIDISMADGKLYLQATGQGKHELFAEKKDAFFLTVVDAQVEFVKDANNTTDKLILHQNGQHMLAPKIK
ncbi:MAG TPA: serine hydrolase [Chitinophagaceae bacterium]|nr:serine hydrolase [Chitinophagaceae bacterium]